LDYMLFLCFLPGHPRNSTCIFKLTEAQGILHCDLWPNNIGTWDTWTLHSLRELSWCFSALKMLLLHSGCGIIASPISAYLDFPTQLPFPLFTLPTCIFDILSGTICLKVPILEILVVEGLLLYFIEFF
jgi:hypothetical protein